MFFTQQYVAQRPSALVLGHPIPGTWPLARAFLLWSWNRPAQWDSPKKGGQSFQPHQGEGSNPVSIDVEVNLGERRRGGQEREQAHLGRLPGGVP